MFYRQRIHTEAGPTPILCWSSTQQLTSIHSVYYYQDNKTYWAATHITLANLDNDVFQQKKKSSQHELAVIVLKDKCAVLDVVLDGGVSRIGQQTAESSSIRENWCRLSMGYRAQEPWALVMCVRVFFSGAGRWWFQLTYCDFIVWFCFCLALCFHAEDLERNDAIVRRVTFTTDCTIPVDLLGFERERHCTGSPLECSSVGIIISTVKLYEMPAVIATQCLTASNHM